MQARVPAQYLLPFHDMATAGHDPDRWWAPVHLDTSAAEDGVAESWLTRGRFDQTCEWFKFASGLTRISLKKTRVNYCKETGGVDWETATRDSVTLIHFFHV